MKISGCAGTVDVTDARQLSLSIVVFLVIIMWALIVLASHLFPPFLLRFQTRLEEHEDVLRSQFEDRERELVELNQLTARRLAQAESKFAALQASKLIPVDLYTAA